ncbi:MAG TPA: hypothetical protein VN775_08565 [Opitutaceae bacterium]|nr:hypothetical protein [Opitutaceae bacterium]
MAADSSGSSLPSWQFMVLLAAAMGAFLTSGRLGSPNPSAVEPTSDKGTLVDAHLTDDPFGPWVRAAKKSDSGGAGPAPGATGGSLPGPINSGDSLRALVGERRVCLLPVIVPGDFHSTEARESRIRFRAAMVSGLGAKGLVADDPEHVLLISPPPAWSLGPGRKPPSVDQPVPAEWFIVGGLPRKGPSPYAAVLVVWVQDESVLVKPLAALDDLRRELTTQLLTSYGIEAAKIDFKVIGPYWSSTLVDILAETKAARSLGKPSAGAETTFYSATATMADGILDLFVDGRTRGPPPKSGPAGPGPEEEPSGRGRLAKREDGPVLVNLTCTDEDLAEAFFNELMLRGVNLGDESTRIAIVSDWDTEYGRVLPLTFAAKLKQIMDPKSGYKPASGAQLAHLRADSYRELRFDDESGWPREILRAYYISGVGGTTASVGGEGKADDSGKSGADSSDSRRFPRAEGEHQVDYIARLGMVLANRLDERDNPGNSAVGRQSKSASPRLRAIGLLGSNVYDELLLLQILRPRFPDAVFFTDKLDARFLDPASTTYTRNLVVASSYGFELFQRRQVGVAPFRSSEQTGAFLAVQAAVGSEMPVRGWLHGSLRQPLRFEIGRTYPVPLIVAPSPAQERHPASTEGADQEKLHPRIDMPLLPHEHFWKNHFFDIALAAAGAALFAAITLFVSLGRVRLDEYEARDIWFVGWLVVAVAAVALLFTAVYDGIEPLTWVEGVSIWPSELFRLLAIATASGSLYYCASRVKRSREVLRSEFGLVAAPPAPLSLSGFAAAVKEVLGRTRPLDDDFLLTDSENKAAVAALEEKTGDYSGAVAAASRLRQGQETPGKGPRYISSELLWRYLCERSTPARRHARVALMTASFALASACLFFVIGPPAAPTRGKFSAICDGVLLSAASVLLLYLVFWVVDEIQSCCRFVARLGREEPSLWPPKAYEGIQSIEKHAERKAASAYIEVSFIGRLTAEAVPLIMLPFVVLTLLVVARWRFFANWPLAPAVLLVLGADAAICALCALLLKRTATEAKRGAVQHIGLNAADARAAGRDGVADALQALQADMEANEEGAFLPWHQQPFVRAVLLPFGGGGVLQAIEFLMSKQ